jgi:hypothetical protein
MTSNNTPLSEHLKNANLINRQKSIPLTHIHYYSLSVFRSWWGVQDTTLCDKDCQWLATSWWFSLSTLVSSTNKTDCYDIVEILLKVELNTITPLCGTHTLVWWTHNHHLLGIWWGSCNIDYYIKILCFHWEANIWKFTLLPNGVSCALRALTKLFTI